jgi:ABC-2 type transport system permease protein
MPSPDARALRPQFRTACRFALIEQMRNRLAALLLVLFVPIWYGLMALIVPHDPLKFRLFSAGVFVRVDGRHLSLITAGLNALTLIVGFAVFAAVRRALPFDRRLVSCGYRQSKLIGAKGLAVTAVACGVGLYATAVLLAFWQPSLGGVVAIALAFVVIALEYGALGLLLGVTVRGDLEGFFLIIMGSLMDTFLQNPLGNPVANKPALEYFPSFGPMQFATSGAFAHTWRAGYLLLGLAWAGGFAALGLVIFQLRTARPPREVLPGRMRRVSSRTTRGTSG